MELFKSRSIVALTMLCSAPASAGQLDWSAFDLTAKMENQQVSCSHDSRIMTGFSSRPVAQGLVGNAAVTAANEDANLDGNRVVITINDKGGFKVLLFRDKQQDACILAEGTGFQMLPPGSQPGDMPRVQR